MPREWEFDEGILRLPDDAPEPALSNGVLVEANPQTVTISFLRREPSAEAAMGLETKPVVEVTYRVWVPLQEFPSIVHQLNVALEKIRKAAEGGEPGGEPPP